MRIFLSISILLIGANAFAAASQCAKYTADVVPSSSSESAQIVIVTHLAEWDSRAQGYGDISTVVSGDVKKSCNTFFNGGDDVCGLKVTRVKLVSDSECWD